MLLIEFFVRLQISAKVQFLDRGNYFLQKSLIYSRHFSKQAHFLGVRNPHVGIWVISCAVWYDEPTWGSQVYEGSE